MPVTAESIRAGVLYAKTCDGEPDLAAWSRLGKHVADFLHVDATALSPSQAARIYHYYLPVYFWVLRRIKAVAKSAPVRRPALIGLTCPQGGGKTTLLETLRHVMASEGRRCVSISIDDFYLPFEEQEAMSHRFSGNHLLQGRGNPGTHDVGLATSTLHSLLKCGLGERVRVPRYDKSLRGAKGDRLPEGQWTEVEGPLDAVLFEGWCLGFRPVPCEAVQDPNLLPINLFLAEQFDQWCPLMDAFVVIQVDDHRWVFEWRREAEHQMIAQGKPGMTDEEVERFCSRYMPSYAQYLPGLYTKEVVPGRQLSFRVDRNRCPVG